MSNPIAVTALEQTCIASPSQWEGKLSDGRYVYVRYRWGVLQMGVGETLKEAVETKIDVARLGGGFHGYLTLDEMTPHLDDFLRTIGHDDRNCRSRKN